MLEKQHTVQSLWSGYGEIARFYSPKLKSPVIVKYVSPPAKQQHPKGWNTETSRQRKLRSYQAEVTFYKRHAKLCDDFCRVPSFIGESKVEGAQLLVLEDLNHTGYALRKTKCGIKDVLLCAKWLAYFHGRFLQHEAPDLWEIGTYWHLSTRKDEFDAMGFSALKGAAQSIDETLNGAQFQTLVHGDAKSANFCFPDNQSVNGLAAVDFQYVGRGIGVKDLAYLMGACLSNEALFEYEQLVLKEYFSHLQSAIAYYQIETDFYALESEWRYLYSFAWADFYRFLLGWSPEHHKINSYMREQSANAMELLGLK